MTKARGSRAAPWPWFCLSASVLGVHAADDGDEAVRAFHLGWAGWVEGGGGAAHWVFGGVPFCGFGRGFGRFCATFHGGAPCG
jgi:hypothetical protein